MVSILMSFGASIMTQAVYSWIGYTFLSSELQRQSNEIILNNLKEGVYIIDEESAKVRFKNNAAVKINRNLFSASRFRLFEEDSADFDLETVNFEIVDK